MRNINSKKPALDFYKLTLMIFILTLAGCSEQKDGIQGRYIWVESVAGWSGTSTPESTGDKMELKVDQSTIAVYKNKELISNFEYVTNESPTDRCASTYVLVGSFFNSCIEIENNLLIITPIGVDDAGYSKWKRKRGIL